MNEEPENHSADAHPTAEDHPSMDHPSKDDPANIHPNSVQNHLEHGAMNHREIESSSTEDHSGHAMKAEPAGHGAAHIDHTGHEQMFRQKFWVSLLLSIPVLIFSPINPELARLQPSIFPRQPMDHTCFCRDRVPVWWGSLPKNGTP